MTIISELQSFRYRKQLKMADPKYADLPGIAYDQPDVYETSDLPESDQNAAYYEEESDSIERLHISANEAFTKFNRSVLDTNNVDFSDTVRKTLRTGYNSRLNELELAGMGEKETPFQKYERLQCEMKELLEEISQIQESLKDAPEQQQPYSQLAGRMEHVCSQMAEVHLEEALGSQLVSNLSDPHNMQHKKLLAKLEGLCQTNADATKVKTNKEDQSISENDSNGLLYQLTYQPEQARLAHTSRIADLDQRLHRLETVLGPEPVKAVGLTTQDIGGHRDAPNGLLEITQQLSARVALLDNSRLDLAESRLAALSAKMDALAEKGQTATQSADRDAKIMELYDLVKKSGDMSQMLPQIVDRMLALETLHHQAVDFSKSLGQLELIQQQITTTLQNNEDLIKQVQQTFSQNLESIKKNLGNLDARVDALKKK
ncbi:dynactin subunit 2-like [Schistocerca piceifrons]|uniref:dynactin subunit 2-like n=1 Tax=Schistocerca piceifrons TaxID=274613 RepID=UPI001F5E975E|nr:dynactin subunit 2-like [Schistocerca piceifrons]